MITFLLKNSIILFFIIGIIIGFYHAYILLGMKIYSLTAFKFGKSKNIYSNNLININDIINELEKNHLVHNKIFHNGKEIILIRNKISLFGITNSILKFRTLIIKYKDKCDVIIYYDIITKYFFILTIYLIPFIFTITLPAIKNNFQVFPLLKFSILIFIIVVILYSIISYFIEKIFINNYIKKISLIIFNDHDYRSV